MPGVENLAGGDAYEKEGVLHFCQPCAEGSQCECGCCEPVEGEDEQETE